MPIEVQLTTGQNPAVLVIDTRVTTAQIDAMADRMSDLRPLLMRIARIMRRAASERFRTGGPGWQELAPSTIAAKRALNMPAAGEDGRAEVSRFRQAGVMSAAETILLRSGALRDSWSRRGDPNNVEMLDESNGTVSIGSRLPYAGVHQKGWGGGMIYPVQAKTLAFMGASGPVFAAYVDHPGIPARPIEMLPRDVARIQRVVEEWLVSNGYEEEGE